VAAERLHMYLVLGVFPLLLRLAQASGRVERPNSRWPGLDNALP
jgi:hypothetical protein